MEKILLAVSKNGVNVYEEAVNAHMAAHTSVKKEHIVEAISSIDIEGTFVFKAVDLGRNIGKNNCVTVKTDDMVKKMIRKNRSASTPIVFGKKAEDTSYIVIGICCNAETDNEYVLFTAFYGIVVPREPWDKYISSKEELAESKEFWATHALVYEPGMVEDEEQAEIHDLTANFDFEKAKAIFAKLGDKDAVSIYKTYITYWNHSGGDWSEENSIEDHEKFESPEDLIEYFKSEEDWSWDYKNREDEYQVGYTLTYGDLAILMDALDPSDLFQAIVPWYWANCENVDEFLGNKNTDGWEYKERSIFNYDYNWENDCFENVKKQDGYVICHYDKELIAQFVEYIINL